MWFSCEMCALHNTDVLSCVYPLLDFPQAYRFALVHRSSARWLTQERNVYVNRCARSSMCSFTNWCKQLQRVVSLMIEKRCSIDATRQAYNWEKLFEYEGTLETEVRFAVAEGVCSLPTEWQALHQYVKHKVVYYTDIVHQAECQYPPFYCVHCDAASHPTFDMCTVRDFLSDAQHLITDWLEQHQCNQVCLSCFLQWHGIHVNQPQRKRDEPSNYLKHSCSTRHQ